MFDGDPPLPLLRPVELLVPAKGPLHFLSEKKRQEGAMSDEEYKDSIDKVWGRVTVSVRARVTVTVRVTVTDLGSFMVPIGLHHCLGFGGGDLRRMTPPP